jgi:hypothetical protein
MHAPTVDRNGDGYVRTELIRSIAGETLRLTVDNDSAQVETVLPERTSVCDRP